MKIVLSYRRSDTEEISGRIFDRLRSQFGPGSVFMDVDSIPFGVDFRRHIQKELEGCDTLLAIIGPRWLGGGRGVRIKEETDYVRLEVETALQRGIPVVPVLVRGAKMPRPDQLPETLQDLRFRNAAPVGSGRDFHAHVDRLIESLGQLLPQPTDSGQKAKQKAAAAADQEGTLALTSEQMVERGNKYRDGEGLAKNIAEAVYWFRKAADLGNTAAMNGLGVMYRDGQVGLAKDEAEAVRWFHQAAGLGDATAMNRLGRLHRDGKGVPQNGTEAVYWFRKAADLGDTDAMNRLGYMYLEGKEVPQNGAEAMRWFRKAADLGNTNAMNGIGIMYRDGEGVAKSGSEAVYWLRRAADLGNTDAMNRLGRMYRDGKEVPQNGSEAMRWFRMAANLQDAAAINRLGDMYEYGKGVAKSKSEALAWYQKAADLGYEKAKAALRRLGG
jgi:TPR repeat protein